MTEVLVKLIESLSEGKKDKKAFETDIFEMLLENADQDVTKALKLCAIPHWFDASIISVLLDIEGEIRSKKLLDRITKYSFVQSRKQGGFIFHDAIREQLLQGWQKFEEKDKWRELSSCLYYFFKEILDNDDNSPFYITAEMIFHHLHAAPEKGFIEWEYGFNNALKNWRLDYANQLLLIAEEKRFLLPEEYSKRLTNYGNYLINLTVSLSDGVNKKDTDDYTKDTDDYKKDIKQIDEEVMDVYQIDIYMKTAKEFIDRYNLCLVGIKELALQTKTLSDQYHHESSIKYAVYSAYSYILCQAITGDDLYLINQAFKELGSFLRPIAYSKYSIDIDKVEDIIQQTLVIIWEKRNLIKSSSSFLLWARNILRNEINQYYKKSSKRIEDEDKIRSYRENIFLDNLDQVESSLLQSERTQTLKDTLNRTLKNHKQRSVIIGLFYEGRSPMDIAKELDCSVADIYILKTRALKTLNNTETISELKELFMYT